MKVKTFFKIILKYLKKDPKSKKKLEKERENPYILLTKQHFCVILSSKIDRGAPQEKYFPCQARAGVAKKKGLGAEESAWRTRLWQLG